MISWIPQLLPFSIAEATKAQFVRQPFILVELHGGGGRGTKCEAAGRAVTGLVHEESRGFPPYF